MRMVFRWYGEGNIFRVFIAMLQQELLNAGKVETGVGAVRLTLEKYLEC